MGQVFEGGSRWRVAGWGLAALILLLPAVAMLVTGEVAWGPGDFLAAAILLGGAGLSLELVVRVTRPGAARWAAGAAVLAALLLVWAELAVGIFG
jgi:hypothetical protein